jgi:hypothetical protein
LPPEIKNGWIISSTLAWTTSFDPELAKVWNKVLAIGYSAKTSRYTGSLSSPSKLNDTNGILNVSGPDYSFSDNSTNSAGEDLGCTGIFPSNCKFILPDYLTMPTLYGGGVDITQPNAWQNVNSNFIFPIFNYEFIPGIFGDEIIVENLKKIAENNLVIMPMISSYPIPYNSFWWYHNYIIQNIMNYSDDEIFLQSIDPGSPFETDLGQNFYFNSDNTFGNYIINNTGVTSFFTNGSLGKAFSGSLSTEYAICLSSYFNAPYILRLPFRPDPTPTPTPTPT